MSQPNLDDMGADFGADPMMAGDPGMGAAPQQMPQQAGPGPGPGMPAPQAPALPKQRFNIYTMMLILSFFALLTACLLLWFELSDYMQGGGWPPWNTSAVGAVQYVAEAATHLA